VSGSDALKKSMYAASFEVLNPYIGRVKQLMYFKDDVVAKFCQNLTLLVRVEKQKKADSHQAPCEGLMIQLMKTLDVLVVLDSIKDTKACLSNDFATYKRAFQFCRGDVPDAEAITQENNLLQPFLANNESITVALKTAVDKVPGHEDVLAAMASLCVECLEQEWHVGCVGMAVQLRTWRAPLGVAPAVAVSPPPQRESTERAQREHRESTERAQREHRGEVSSVPGSLSRLPGTCCRRRSTGCCAAPCTRSGCSTSPTGASRPSSTS